MIERFKTNTKIKLISLLSAVVLWLYVMAVVDPEETKLFEGMPVTISNMDELRDKDLVIYPKIDLTTDISVSGKLSKLQKVNKDNIHIYGQINNPMEGSNDIYLRANTPGQVTHEIRNNILIVNLEKIVSEQKPIDIQAEGKHKSNVARATVDKGIDSIGVSGPRSQVKLVDKIVGVVDVGSNTNDFTAQIKLFPVDKDGNEVKDVELEKSSVTVNVELLKEKTVPIQIKFTQDSNPDIKLKDYTLSQESIVIKGKKDVVDKIDYIETEPLNINDIANSTSKDLGLSIPEGISTDTKYITIKLKTVKTIKESFVYTKPEIQIRNKTEDIDISKIDIPDNINVNIEYLENIGTITKEDIVLYIDVSQDISETQKYDIKYETESDIKNVVITPDKTL
ncbi:CdaR family protein [Romboutsia lituseburensis]|uniref:YbbR domain-containing protein n=1 Tax=Romboutsia lituseburensis DSM 797 TaxID=1121325 RepID=A0A1G9S9P4_9FIRM|nr:CdaR family protein [Romboutsia lituseburensis]CEH35954.1 YbbR-like protein [Romboutsia lituseburensis]SDM32176.1 YbbR domain-containing protein [Romboutsia lituseburensis DSM 797]